MRDILVIYWHQCSLTFIRWCTFAYLPVFGIVATVAWSLRLHNSALCFCFLTPVLCYCVYCDILFYRYKYVMPVFFISVSLRRLICCRSIEHVPFIRESPTWITFFYCNFASASLIGLHVWEAGKVTALPCTFWGVSLTDSHRVCSSIVRLYRHWYYIPACAVLLVWYLGCSFCSLMYRPRNTAPSLYKYGINRMRVNWCLSRMFLLDVLAQYTGFLWIQCMTSLRTSFHTLTGSNGNNLRLFQGYSRIVITYLAILPTRW